MRQEHCIVCGIAFGAPFEWWQQRQRDGRKIFCPNGHEWSYSQLTEIERRDKVIAELNAKLELRNQWVTRAEHQRNALRGQVTKLKRRLAR